MACATIESKGKDPFVAEIVELRPDRILLRSERSLPFRTVVAVEVAGVRVHGEVVHTYKDTIGITFPVVPEIFSAIETVDIESPTNDLGPPDGAMAEIDDALSNYVAPEQPEERQDSLLPVVVMGPGLEKPVMIPERPKKPPPTITRETFTGPIGLRRLLAAQDGEDHSYLGVLLRSFDLTKELVLELLGGHQQVSLWITGGRVVFAQRKPVDEGDLIGRRLAERKFVGRRTIDAALNLVPAGKSLGASMIERGQLAPSDLHRALRAQTIDRALLYAAEDGGEAIRRPWEDPPIEGKLLPVPGGSIVAELIRRAVRRITPPDIHHVLGPFEDEPVSISLAKIEPSYRLKDAEFRVLQHFVTNPSTVGMFLRMGGLRYRHATTLLMMGEVFGFATFSRSVS